MYDTRKDHIEIALCYVAHDAPFSVESVEDSRFCRSVFYRQWAQSVFFSQYAALLLCCAASHFNRDSISVQNITNVLGSMCDLVDESEERDTCDDTLYCGPNTPAIANPHSLLWSVEELPHEVAEKELYGDVDEARRMLYTLCEDAGLIDCDPVAETPLKYLLGGDRDEYATF